MAAVRSLALRQTLAAVLVLALALVGAGRGLADAAMGPAGSVVIAGVVVPLCDPLRQDGSGPPDTHHDCCDRCALCAPAMPPSPPALALPSATGRPVRLAAMAVPVPHLARQRTPRQAQAPPAA